MQLVAVVAQRHTCTDHQLVDVYLLINVHHILALRMDLDQHLVLAHDLQHERRAESVPNL